jgi:tetratricopeptide (TPR) repeat protein
MTLYNLDPRNFASQANLGSALMTLGDTYASSGRIREALPNYPRGLKYVAESATSGAFLALQYVYEVASYTETQASLGDTAAAAATLQRIGPVQAQLLKDQPKGALVPMLVDALAKYGAGAIALRQGDLQTAQRLAWEAMKEAESGKTTPGFEEVQKYVTIYSAAHVAGQADYRIGNIVTAEQAERTAIERRHQYQDQQVGDRRDIAIKSTWLAMAVARQGRTDEAAKIIAPFVTFDRELMARNHGDQFLAIELAGVLYTQALTDQAQAAGLLHEAATLIDSVSAELRATPDVRLWRERIAAGIPAN